MVQLEGAIAFKVIMILPLSAPLPWICFPTSWQLLHSSLSCETLATCCQELWGPPKVRGSGWLAQFVILQDLVVRSCKSGTLWTTGTYWTGRCVIKFPSRDAHQRHKMCNWRKKVTRWRHKSRIPRDSGIWGRLWGTGKMLIDGEGGGRLPCGMSGGFLFSAWSRVTAGWLPAENGLVCRNGRHSPGFRL